jgi:hypothetical protein
MSKRRFALHEHHPAMRRQAGGHRQAGYAAADDRKLEVAIDHVGKLQNRAIPVNEALQRRAIL